MRPAGVLRPVTLQANEQVLLRTRRPILLEEFSRCILDPCGQAAELRPHSPTSFRRCNSGSMLPCSTRWTRTSSSVNA